MMPYNGPILLAEQANGLRKEKGDADRVALFA
jgi:hypothetical protein